MIIFLNLFEPITLLARLWGELNEHGHIKRSVDQITDELLVQRCQNGSRPAFEVLLRRWQEPLWRHAVRSTREPSLADDVLQDSLLAIVRNIRRLDDPARFRAWAFRIISNKATDHIRKRQRNRKAEAETIGQEASSMKSTSPDRPAELVREAMKSLEPKDRLILSLFYLDEMNVREVADICDIPPGTVKSRLYHARAKLKEILENNQNENH